MPGIRCFVGVELPGTLATALVSCANAIKTVDPGWRAEKWVAPENLHLTLHFLGDVEPGALVQLRASISHEAVPVEPFKLPFAGVRAAPTTRAARTLWAEYSDPHGACERLARALSEAAGSPREPGSARAFRAHVTLCRARRPRAVDSAALTEADDVLAVLGATMSVPSFTLFASRLTPHGPIYEVLDRWVLKGDGTIR